MKSILVWFRDYCTPLSDGAEFGSHYRFARRLIRAHCLTAGKGRIIVPLMANPRRHRSSISRNSPREAGKTVALLILLALTLVATRATQAQTFSVIHAFSGGPDGANPFAGVTIDGAGNLYGTAAAGGAGYGTVFRLSRLGPSWILTPLYQFASANDGAAPWAGVTIGPNGNLYGTTAAGGNQSCQQSGFAGCGTVFKLSPPARACRSVICSWTETKYAFNGSNGANPFARVVFDHAGNLYGTTFDGGNGSGLVYELTPSGGSWTENILDNFTGCSGCGPAPANPFAEVVFDQSGNLYGTTWDGGVSGVGTVFQLAPSASGWTEKPLYTFQGGSDGAEPAAGLIFDNLGNLYGATLSGGPGGRLGGNVFELTPAGDGYAFKVLYGLSGNGGPYASLTMDAEGNLYGTTVADGAYLAGSVFKLTPMGGGAWRYTSLHDFTGGSDGSTPQSTLVFDSSGNLYGTAAYGGAHGNGVVFEITP